MLKKIGKITGIRDYNIIIKDYQQASIEFDHEFITNCPLFPKYNYLEDKIIVRNIPDCESTKKLIKKFLISKFCQNENDFHDYTITWVIDITNPSCCSSFNLNENEKIINNSITVNKARGPKEIKGCINTCNTLAKAADFICGCLDKIAKRLIVACKATCLIFVETLREACEWCCENGGIQDKCWKSFETWKDDFKEQNPECPHRLKDVLKAHKKKYD